MNLAYIVLQFLKGTIGLSLMFHKSGTMTLGIYIDVEYARCTLDRRSIL